MSYKKIRLSSDQIKTELKKMVGLSLSSVAVAPLLLLATDLAGNVSLTSGLGTSKALLVSVAAAVFLKERDDLKIKVASASLSLVGAMLI